MRVHDAIRLDGDPRVGWSVRPSNPRRHRRHVAQPLRGGLRQDRRPTPGHLLHPLPHHSPNKPCAAATRWTAPPNTSATAAPPHCRWRLPKCAGGRRGSNGLLIEGVARSLTCHLETASDLLLCDSEGRASRTMGYCLSGATALADHPHLPILAPNGGEQWKHGARKSTTTASIPHSGTQAAKANLLATSPA